MLVEDQADALAFLADPKSHGAASEAVSTCQTHISTIVLVGDRAFKLKRAVRLPYLDFSTPARRLAACEQELALNRRTAPTLYRAVRRITREPDGGLAFDGRGVLVDAVVEMHRFEDESLFDAMAGRAVLTPGLLTELSRAIARFHDDLPPVHACGGAAGIAAVLDINARALATTRVFPEQEVQGFNAAFRDALARHEPLLDARERAGKVRRCHGDLHLHNICLVEGAPVLFDCLEFNEAMATIDVLYDLAFLLMDLWHRDLRSAANLVFNRYLDARDEIDGLRLMPFFMALRAAVRAHVGATQAEEADPSRRDDVIREARAYFDLARALLRPATARLVAIGGHSGTGKSTVAAAIAHRVGPPPGARILASDRIRKELHGVTAETRLAKQAYAPAISERVYACVADRAARILAGGGAVIADAVFDRGRDRARIEGVAAMSRVPFTGLWLEAPEPTLIERVAARRGDASDADATVVRAQAARKPEPTNWITLSSSGGPQATTAAVLYALTLGGRQEV